MSDCDVCIGVDSIEEPFDFSKVEIRKARIRHVCCECRQPILPGSRYEHVLGKYDGEFTSYKTCLLCAEVRDIFTCGNSWYYGCLWDDMQESAFPSLTTASSCFVKLSPQAKAFVLERWRRWKF